MDKESGIGTVIYVNLNRKISFNFKKERIIIYVR